MLVKLAERFYNSLAYLQSSVQCNSKVSLEVVHKVILPSLTLWGRDVIGHTFGSG